ncbi:hypothetical protein ACHAXT_005889 [Thalassiosira profunda]
MDLRDNIIPAEHWLASHGRAYANAMAQFQLSLANGTEELNRVHRLLREERLFQPIGRTEVEIEPFPPGLLPLVHDDVLMPLWEQLTQLLRALATSAAPHGPRFSLRLVIGNVQLHDVVLDLLLPALESMPLEELCLKNNRLSQRGFESLTRFLYSNSSLRLVFIANNKSESGVAASSLALAAMRRPSLETFKMSTFKMSECMDGEPTSMTGNPYRLTGAVLDAAAISNHLSHNPPIRHLSLRLNRFDDKDAPLFANSLQQNTNLRSLDLAINYFTDSGAQTLGKAVYDDSSLNAMHDTNSTCEVRLRCGLFPYIGVDEAALSLNRLFIERSAFSDEVLARYVRAANGDMAFADQQLQVRGRRMIKALYALTKGNGSTLRMDLLESVPAFLMPNLLVFLEESSSYAGASSSKDLAWKWVSPIKMWKINVLGTLFEVLRSRPDALMSTCAVPEAIALVREILDDRLLFSTFASVVDPTLRPPKPHLFSASRKVILSPEKVQKMLETPGFIDHYLTRHQVVQYYTNHKPSFALDIARAASNPFGSYVLAGMRVKKKTAAVVLSIIWNKRGWLGDNC